MHRKFKFCAMVIAACLFAPFKSMAQSTAPPKPITHEALWMMKRVGPPALSPDGKWVVYSVLEPSYETDKSVSDLWLVPADGLKAPHRITQNFYGGFKSQMAARRQGNPVRVPGVSQCGGRRR